MSTRLPINKATEGVILWIVKLHLVSIGVCLLVASGLLETVLAESKEDGIAVYKEAEYMRGKAQTTQDWEKTLVKYQQALFIFERNQSEKNIGLVLAKIGSICNNLGRYEDALQAYEKALSIFRKLGEEKNEGGALHNIGLVYKNWGQQAKAIEYYDKSLLISAKLGDLRGQGRTMINMGEVYRSQGQYPRALEYYEKALAIVRQTGDVKTEGTVLNSLGLVHKSRGQHEKALEYYEESLSKYSKLGDLAGESATLANMAELYRYWGQYPKALEYQQKALVTVKKIGDGKVEGTILNNIGVVYSEWGRYPRALEYYEKSLAIRTELRDLGGEGASLANIGQIYGHLGQFQKALDSYKTALAIFRKAGDLKSEATVLKNSGAILAVLCEYEKALGNYHTALEIENKIGVSTILTKGLIADMYLDARQIDKAERTIKEAKYNTLLGRLCLLKGDYSGAVRYYQEELARSDRSRNADNQFAACTGLALALEGLKKYEDAAEHFRRAIDLTEKVRDGLNETQRIDFYNVRIQGHSRMAPYEGLCRVLIQLGRHEESFKAAEATRSRLFSELLSRRSQDASFDLPKDLIERDADITNRLAALVQGLNSAFEKGSEDAIQFFERQVTELQAKREVIVHRDPPWRGVFVQIGYESFFLSRAISRRISDSLLTGCGK